MAVPPLALFGWVVARRTRLVLGGRRCCCWPSGLALNLIDSPTGRALQAMHGSEVAARVAGVDTTALQAARVRALGRVRQRCRQPQRALRRLRDAGDGRLLPFDRAGDHGGDRRHGVGVRLVIGAALLTLLPQLLSTLRGLGNRGVRRDPDADDDLPAEGAWCRRMRRCASDRRGAH